MTSYNGGGYGGRAFRNNYNGNFGRRGGGAGRRDQRREPTDSPPTPKLSTPEIKRSQQETTVANFSSSELTYNGSDRLVFITNGTPITTVWKRILNRRNPLNQNDARIFISSALVATDHRTGYEVEDLITNLGDPEKGLKKLREIINFPSMSCDAGLRHNTLSFQYVVLPLLGLLTRTAITECILEKYVHAIYMVVYTNLDSFLYNEVMKMLDMLVQRNSVADKLVSVEELLSHEPYSYIPSSLGVFFLIIVRLLTELLRRIKEASINETMHKIAYDLQQLKTAYLQSLERQSPSSTDPLITNLETRNYFIMILEKEMKIMNKMLNNSNNNLILEQKPDSKESTRLYYEELARKADMKRSYDPPGELSKNGKRHDNDFIEISEISIIPTREEILCDRQPFLPSSLSDTPHFLHDGMDKLFDIQFRLLREDMLNPIRGGISSFLAALSKDWSSTSNRNKLSQELKKVQEKGGRFKYDNGGNNHGYLQVYTYVQFVSINCDRRKGFHCTLRFTPPNIRGNKKREYWNKKLLAGNLVALILPNTNPNPNRKSNSDLYSLYIGVVISRDEVALAERAEININFIDPSIYAIASNEILNSQKSKTMFLENRFMVESTGVYLETYYHILKTLQITNPYSLPFEKYFAPNFDKRTSNSVEVGVDTPIYTRAPGFQFDLSVLFRNKKQETKETKENTRTPLTPLESFLARRNNERRIQFKRNDEQSLKLNVADANTHDEVAKNITERCKLDETQAKALIYALTHEIALIEGPPGTGKSVVGIEIMKVLLANKNQGTDGPILTICFTNHALDQFLEHLLDEEITNIVRLGSRSKSEKIKNFNLEAVCKTRGFHGNLSYQVKELHQNLEEIERKVDITNKTFFNKRMEWEDVQEYLKREEEIFYKKFMGDDDDFFLPKWVLETMEKNDEYQIQNRRRKNLSQKNLSRFDKWVKGEDIIIINERKEMLKNDKNKSKNGSNENIYAQLLLDDDDKSQTDVKSQIDNEIIQWIGDYTEPKSNRPLDVLLNECLIWEMSREERKTLHDHWRTKLYHEIVEKLSELQKSHEEYRQEMNSIYDQGRREALLGSDVVGVTTSGVAKFQSLIRSIRPKIIICEEAGEVLEAHILSALTESTQHLILIGDHNQLRPHIATYSLSMDSSIGKKYQLDKSLFERLVRGDNAVKIEKAQLLTQRRMRKKEISDLIRHTLYPNLIDGENTAEYPDVRGAQHNVYFIDHRHPEDNSGGEFAMQSHVNRYEIEMVVEMVKYFVRNGYTKPNDIAVLTPYLGQMMKIKDALANSFVVVIDERDAQKIAEMEEEQKNKNDDEKGRKREDNINRNIIASTKLLKQHVTLRTVDNFQGEEASIVIISLVRNFSESGEHDSIGFLKSSNRSNVLLSRAREGMYLIGNSELMAAKSDMWARVIKTLQTRNPSQVGFGMPIVCNQHPDYKNIIIEPEQFVQVSPDGGCYEKCHKPLPCGHACTYKCHSDDPKHIRVKCPEPCNKPLPCGHTCTYKCHLDDPEHMKARCIKPCPKLLPQCNHPCPKRCSEDCGRCNFPAGDIILSGCGHKLQNAKCWQNQTKETLKCMTLVTREFSYCGHSNAIRCSESVCDVDCRKTCQKILKCGHECLRKCFECKKYSTSALKKNSISRKHSSQLVEPEDGNKIDAIIPIEQMQHGQCKHICDRLLFCGHLCKQYCHEGNECPPCENKCTVSCEHTACNKSCLEPCAVCAEKCLWECEHQGKCELSCGAPCYRLPCNERCNKKLKCGHKCAGVCGEICPSKVFCVECAPEKVKSQVSDLIISTPFSEVDWNEERMIVLSCGHVYTMETMDGIMEMGDYYEGSIEEGWTTVKILPTSPTNTKTCPTCRKPIKDIRRYGRIVKKCILDTQNKKFLSKYGNQLKEIIQQVTSLVSPEGKMRSRCKLKHESAEFDSRKIVSLKENQELPEIIPNYYFHKIKKYHGFDGNSERVWIAHVEKLLKCYQKLTLIIYATKMPPHKRAFEAAVSSLYQAKLNLSNSHISDASSNFNPPSESLQLIFQETLSQIGISIPQVDRRIYLDALLEIINIQKILYREILSIIQGLIEDDYGMGNLKIGWKNFAEKLQNSIQIHLYVVKEVAESTRYGRHLLLVNVEILEFDLKVLKYQLKYPPNRSSAIDKALQRRIIEKCGEIKKSISDIIRSDGYINSEKKFKGDIRERLDNLTKNCDEVEICTEDLSKTLSIEEKFEIHRAMQSEFRGSGHWYECPNGHPYTIGECGGAMEMSRCPECNAGIGGGSHRLTIGNRVNSEFDSMRR